MDMQPIHSDALLHGSVVTGTARPPGFDHPRCMLESSEVQEQESLLRLLQERTATQPETTAGELLQWYQERIKESRTRLVHGSADSSESAAHLVQYAARRHDVATLQELRKHADAWEHRTRRTHSLPLPPPTDAAHPRVPLTAKIDNILFSLAARQRNWRVMCMLATSRARAQQWTPFMCRAFLRAEYAYSGNGVEDAASLECRRKLWDIFRAQFGPQLKSVDDMASDPSAELRRQSTPPWLLVFMLQMHARSGDADAALRLIQHYLESVRQTQPLPAVLRRGPSQLLTRRKQRIPGPTLLNALLHSLLRAGRPEDALFAFSRLTALEIPQAKPPRADVAAALTAADSVHLEPDSTSLLAVLRALCAAPAPDAAHVRSCFEFLRSVDRQLGLFRAPRALCGAEPLFIDLRVMTYLIQLALEADDQGLLRRIVRFQEGLLRRELRWHTDATRSTAHGSRIWRHAPNEFAMLQRWNATLAACCRRRWIRQQHRASLYGMAKRLAVLYRQLRLPKSARRR